MANDFFKQGSHGSDSVVGLKQFMAKITTSNRYCTLQVPAGTFYQVTAGKTLYITRFLFQGAATGDGPLIGYADTALNDAAGPPTNPVDMTSNFQSAVSDQIYDIPVLIAIPASKFPYILEGAAAMQVNAYLEGFEA